MKKRLRPTACLRISKCNLGRSSLTCQVCCQTKEHGNWKVRSKAYWEWRSVTKVGTLLWLALWLKAKRSSRLQTWKAVSLWWFSEVIMILSTICTSTQTTIFWLVAPLMAPVKFGIWKKKKSTTRTTWTTLKTMNTFSTSSSFTQVSSMAPSSTQTFTVTNLEKCTSPQFALTRK